MRINWKVVGLGAVAALFKLGHIAMQPQHQVRGRRLDDYGRTRPHPLENTVAVNQGGYAFSTRHVWVCECGSRGRGSVSQYDADRLARDHVMKKDIGESHNWHIEQEYPPEEGWFRWDGSPW